MEGAGRQFEAPSKGLYVAYFFLDFGARKSS